MGAEPESKNLALQADLTVTDHQWDCNCKGTYDVCSYTTCAYVASCGSASLRSWPNAHNESASLSSEAGDHSWHCNCGGTYSWCSYTTCYSSCGSLEAAADEVDSDLPSLEVQAEPASKNLASQDDLTVGDHQWDCNCKGTYDVCSFTTCAYVSSCGSSAELRSWPNEHNESKSLSTQAGDHSWHCNCKGTYSWCSYTTCYSACGSLEADTDSLMTSFVV